jgi:hypothetical protein
MTAAPTARRILGREDDQDRVSAPAPEPSGRSPSQPAPRATTRERVGAKCANDGASASSTCDREPGDTPHQALSKLNEAVKPNEPRWTLCNNIRNSGLRVCVNAVLRAGIRPCLVNIASLPTGSCGPLERAPVSLLLSPWHALRGTSVLCSTDRGLQQRPWVTPSSARAVGSGFIMETLSGTSVATRPRRVWHLP